MIITFNLCVIVLEVNFFHLNEKKTLNLLDDMNNSYLLFSYFNLILLWPVQGIYFIMGLSNHRNGPKLT